MKKTILGLMPLLVASMLIAGCGKKAESSAPASSSEAPVSSSSEAKSYTCEEAINAVAVALGKNTSAGTPTDVSDYSDEEGPYFITGLAFAAASVDVAAMKAIAEGAMPEGFEKVQDWAPDTFSDDTPFEGSYYLCGEVVLGNAVYSDTISGVEATVLQVACYLNPAA